MSDHEQPYDSSAVAVIGAGPAGLMAAERLALHGYSVQVFDAMPSVGRKFLLAGIGGLNITHAEDAEIFKTRYFERCASLTPMIEQFGADQLRAWVHELGIETFVGTSQRVFPKEMKAAPLLRAWITRLRKIGVVFHSRHRWLGWLPSGELHFNCPEGHRHISALACVLALGGASWSKLGSDGSWVAFLSEIGVDIAPLKAANCGFNVKQPWSVHLRGKFSGQPLKPVAIEFVDSLGTRFNRQGEFIITDNGVEGSLIYAVSALIREEILRLGSATIYLDLMPAKTAEQIEEKLQHPRGSKSLSNHLHSRLGLQGIKTALLYELLSKDQMNHTAQLAQLIKRLPVTLGSTRPIDEAISTAGGVRFEALDSNLMCKAKPGLFCSGEMLDWEAPTGGYLLTAVMATGYGAGEGAATWLKSLR